MILIKKQIVAKDYFYLFLLNQKANRIKIFQNEIKLIDQLLKAKKRKKKQIKIIMKRKWKRKEKNFLKNN